MWLLWFLLLSVFPHVLLVTVMLVARSSTATAFAHKYSALMTNTIVLHHVSGFQHSTFECPVYVTVAMPLLHEHMVVTCLDEHLHQ